MGASYFQDLRDQVLAPCDMGMKAKQVRHGPTDRVRTAEKPTHPMTRPMRSTRMSRVWPLGAVVVAGICVLRKASGGRPKTLHKSSHKAAPKPSTSKKKP